jgi:hypothetical protein
VRVLFESTKTKNSKQKKRSSSIIYTAQRKYCNIKQKVCIPTKIACILKKPEMQLVC